MKIGRLLSAIGVAASVALASTASAKTSSVEWTCNSDGFLHVKITGDNGSVREWIYGSCGPEIAVGRGFNLVFGDKKVVSPRGQTFLNSLERSSASPARRIPGKAEGKSRAPSGQTETIQLMRADVGPQLAAFLTSNDAGWKTEGSGASKAFSIFDRWGNLITAQGPVALVPGDVGLTIPVKGEGGDKRNAKQRCLDKHGVWREKPAGEWGCWTSAK